MNMFLALLRLEQEVFEDLFFETCVGSVDLLDSRRLVVAKTQDLFPFSAVNP